MLLWMITPNNVLAKTVESSSSKANTYALLHSNPPLKKKSSRPYSHMHSSALHMENLLAEPRTSWYHLCMRKQTCGHSTFLILFILLQEWEMFSDEVACLLAKGILPGSAWTTYLGCCGIPEGDDRLGIELRARASVLSP